MNRLKRRSPARHRNCHADSRAAEMVARRPQIWLALQWQGQNGIGL